jgi:hypothetical protein
MVGNDRFVCRMCNDCFADSSPFDYAASQLHSGQALRVWNDQRGLV